MSYVGYLQSLGSDAPGSRGQFKIPDSSGCHSVAVRGQGRQGRNQKEHVRGAEGGGEQAGADREWQEGSRE